jgi:DNA-binding transcriptional ArsR family regulator
MAVKRSFSSSKPRPATDDAGPPEGMHEIVAELFGVLAEPTRLRILQHLEKGPATVTELIEAVGIKQANASKQLGIMHRAGLLDREKDGNSVRYRIRMPLVIKLCDLVCGELHREALLRARTLADRP